MDSLNNMQKTALKLDKEINSLGLNMTKVHKKEHSKMKNIINNINNLLKKDSKQNNINFNKVDKYMNYIKHKEKSEEINNKTIQSFKNNKNNNHNIDCILISLKQTSNRNKRELDFNKETIFNENQKNSSKLLNRRKKDNNLTSDDKFMANRKDICENMKPDNLIIKQRSKYLGKSRNNNNLMSNQMTYSRPKLNNKFSNFNLTKQNQRANSSKNHFVNNNFDKNDKANSLIKMNDKNKTISNQKYSFKKRKCCKNNKNCENIINKNAIYISKKDKNTEKSFKKELLYDKNNYYLDELERKENEKNNEYEGLSEKDFSIIKNKNLVFNLQSESNNTYDYNKESKINSSIQDNKNIKTNRANRDFLFYENNKNSKKPYLVKKEENKINMKSFDGIKINDEDLYINEFNNYNRKKINIKKVNYSIDEHNINYNNEEENNIKLTKLLNMLKVNNINEAVSKVAKLIKLKKYIDTCQKIYDEDSNNDYINNRINNDKNYNNFQWLSEMIKNYKENKIYKNYCESIMINNKIERFVDFKKFINQILINNKKNNGFLVEVKNILCKDDLYSNTNEKKNINKNNFNSHKQSSKKNNNTTFHELENSNDIKFSRNDENLVINHDWIKTYYY